MNCRILFLLLLLSVACHDQTEQPSYISLAEHEITTDFNGVQKQIAVRSNCVWKIGGTPPWCDVRKMTGDGNDFLMVHVLPNDTETLRETQIVLAYGQTSASLFVSQTGEEPATTDPLQWYTFAFNNLTDQRFTLQPDNSTRNYRIVAQKYFINPAFAEQVYPGHIIDCHTDNRSLTVYDRLTYNPVHLSAFVDGVLYDQEITPSYEGLKAFVQPILNNIPEQNEEFFYSSPIPFYSYRHLHLLGFGNMGLHLDEVLTGKPYTAKEMDKRTGMIFNYTAELFTVVMDHPEKLIDEEIGKEELSDMLYVNAVTYGRTALMLVESDSEFKEVKRVVGKIIRSEQLTEEESGIKRGLTVSYLYFDKEGAVRTVHGGDELIGRFASEIATLDPAPLSFSTNRLATHEVGALYIEFPLP